MARTLKERLIAGLLQVGWQRVENERSHYTAFQKVGENRKLFVGTSGALRSGECASRSHSLQYQPVYQDLLKVGDEVLDRAENKMKYA